MKKSIFVSIRSALLFLTITTYTVNGLWTPLAAKFKIADFEKFKLNIETDFNLGYELKHIDKPSEYNELADEYITSV